MQDINQDILLENIFNLIQKDIMMHAVNDVFNYLKENYKIKSKETIEFLVPDMVKKDFLNSE